MHGEFAEICRTKVHSYRRFAEDSFGPDTLETEARIVGLKKNIGKTLTRYPSTRQFIVLCKNSINPSERTAAMDVILAVGKKPSKITPITQVVWRLELSRRERSYRGRIRTRKSLIEDLLSYILGAPVQSDYSGISKVFASGLANMSTKRRQRFRRILDNDYDFFYMRGETETGDAEYWEQVVTSSHFPSILKQKHKWISEILRSAVRDTKLDMSEIIEAASWVSEHGSLQKSSIKWVLPNVIIGSDSGSNQVDVCSVFIRGRTTVIRLIEYTKSDSGSKAVSDLEKLEKIKAKCQIFEDLSLKPFVYGASGVREHFPPVEQMLNSFRIKPR